MTNIGSGPGIGSGSQFDINPARAVAASAPVAAATSTPGASDATPATTTAPAASTTSAVSGTLGTGGATVNADRVAAISKAIKHGDYPLIPTKIGDAMIAAGVMLRTAS